MTMKKNKKCTYLLTNLSSSGDDIQTLSVTRVVDCRTTSAVMLRPGTASIQPTRPRQHASAATATTTMIRLPDASVCPRANITEFSAPLFIHLFIHSFIHSFKIRQHSLAIFSCFCVYTFTADFNVCTV